MSTLLAKAKLKPEFEDFFENIARKVFRSTHDNEPAVVRYEYFRELMSAHTMSYYRLRILTGL